VSLSERRRQNPSRHSERLLKKFGTKKNFNATDVYQKTQETHQTAHGQRWRNEELRSAFAERNMDARSIGRLPAKERFQPRNRARVY
jgi:hypothetical protein